MTYLKAQEKLRCVRYVFEGLKEILPCFCCRHCHLLVECSILLTPFLHSYVYTHLGTALDESMCCIESQLPHP